MKSGKSTAYRVVAVFDSWSSDAVLDFRHESGRARRAGRPSPRMPEAGSQEVVLGGNFDRRPSAGEIDAATAAAGSYAQSWDGQARLRSRHVLDEAQWILLVGDDHLKIDDHMRAAEEGEFASATMAASFPAGGEADEAIKTAIASDRPAEEPMA